MGGLTCNAHSTFRLQRLSTNQSGITIELTKASFLGAFFYGGNMTEQTTTDTSKENAGAGAGANAGAGNQETSKKKVRVVALRDFSVGEGADKKVVPIGKEVLVTEEEAKELCDKGFKGPLEGHGEGSYGAFMIFKAKRVLKTA